jgi:hypothetical protein
MKGICIALTFAVVAGTGREVLALSPGAPIGPTSRVWITGTSNLRQFTCEARQVDGTLALVGIATRGPVLSGENVSAQPSLTVPVAGLECGIGAMNRHLRETLLGAEHAVIAFSLASYDVDLTGPAPVAHLVGAVTVAGVRRAVTVTAAVGVDSLGAMHVRGSHVIRMTDFGVRPPRRFGGLLRVRDHITVHFDVVPDPDGTIDGIRCSLAAPAVERPNPGVPHVTNE